MAIFGTIDAKALANNVSVTNNSTTVTTTGDFTDRTSANFVQNGDVLSLGGVQYTVESVVSATSLKLRTAYAGSTGTVLAANAIRRTPPKEVATLLLDENGQLAHFPSGTNLIFIDDTEAALDENKIRGLKWPGWWLYRTYTDGDGNTRHKAECLAFANQTAANAGDYAAAQGGTEDNPAADVASAITISAQPSNQSTDDGVGTATFSVTAAVGTGTLTYQWQVQTSASTTRWSNVVGATSASLALTGLVVGDSGKKFRVKIGGSAGGEEVISNTATLTVTAA